MTANFYDAACDYPEESFEQITHRLLGAKGFPKTENADLFEQDCREAFKIGHQKDQFSSPLSMLRLTAVHLKKIKFPQLIRPQVAPTQPVTRELVNWGIQVYCLPRVKHFGTLISGIATLCDSDNKAAVRILGRSTFELSAHVYYVKKHLKQNLDADDLSRAWDFLTPIGIGSRYINEIQPEENEPFPAPPPVHKAINCFKEAMPEGTEDDYSYLSEFCHPNAMAFQQHYRWTTPYIIDFVDEVPFGAFGTIAVSAIQGLMAAEELLGIGEEKEVRKAIHGLFIAIAEQSKEASGGVNESSTASAEGPKSAA
jgi:hypothetical protein